MENNELIPEDIQRFILRSIESVPHLEAILLLRGNPSTEWDAKMMAQRLYISEARAGELLSDLCSSGFAKVQKVTETLYHYSPITPELGEVVNRLSDIYSENLIEVTNLIHSKTGKQAQKFGDAFKWQKEKD